MADTLPPKLPDQGGSYVRSGDDDLKRVAYTKPADAAPATEPGKPADGGDSVVSPDDTTGQE